MAYSLDHNATQLGDFLTCTQARHDYQTTAQTKAKKSRFADSHRHLGDVAWGDELPQGRVSNGQRCAREGAAEGAVAQKSSRMDLNRWYLPRRPLTYATCGKCVIGDPRILISVRLLCVLHVRHLSSSFCAPFCESLSHQSCNAQSCPALGWSL